MAGSQVTIAQIEAAEALLGLALTAAERRQMAGNLDDQQGIVAKQRCPGQPVRSKAAGVHDADRAGCHRLCDQPLFA